MWRSSHYVRAGLLIVGGFFSFFIFRALMLPHSFGQYGHYRGDNVEEQRAKPIAFADRSACAECHTEVAEKHTGGKHATVQCQNCHAPLLHHIKDGAVIAVMPINRDPKLCLRCHNALPSRPHEFPQIEPKEHVETMGQTMTEGVCLLCHDKHNPTLGATDGK